MKTFELNIVKIRLRAFRRHTRRGLGVARCALAAFLIGWLVGPIGAFAQSSAAETIKESSRVGGWRLEYATQADGPSVCRVRRAYGPRTEMQIAVFSDSSLGFVMMRMNGSTRSSENAAATTEAATAPIIARFQMPSGLETNELERDRERATDDIVFAAIVRSDVQATLLRRALWVSFSYDGTTTRRFGLKGSNRAIGGLVRCIQRHF